MRVAQEVLLLLQLQTDWQCWSTLNLLRNKSRRLRIDFCGRMQKKMREAAEALRLTAQDLKKLGVTDLIVPETLGGAHRATALVTIRSVGNSDK